MKLGEIEIPPLEGEGPEMTEWLVINQCDGYVSISVDYVSQARGERCSWQDQGIAVADHHVGRLIEALQRAKGAHEKGTP